MERMRQTMDQTVEQHMRSKHRRCGSGSSKTRLESSEARIWRACVKRLKADYSESMMKTEQQLGT